MPAHVEDLEANVVRYGIDAAVISTGPPDAYLGDELAIWAALLRLPLASLGLPPPEPGGEVVDRAATLGLARWNPPRLDMQV